VAFRNIKRHKGYSFINISGLAIGMACCIMILLWVQDELSYDNYHKDADHIFRVIVDIQTKTGNWVFAPASAPLAPALKKDFPQVEKAVRFWESSDLLIKYGERKKFYEGDLFYVDPEVFEVFTIPFIKGNPKTALSRPSTFVITEEIAQKYFGNEDPLGKSLTLGNQDYEITGVVKNIPKNSHFKFNFLTSLKQFETLQFMNDWFSTDFYSYIKTKSHVDKKAFEGKIQHFADRYVGDELKKLGAGFTYFLQPIKNIHLHSHLRYELEAPGNVAYIYIFSAIALFVLFIACFNFINLTTARSANRAREVGIRKVVGAYKTKLMKQFLSESVFMSVLALILAIMIISTVLPWFNELSGKELSLITLMNTEALLILIGTALFAGIVAGCYPAFFLSAFRPVVVLRGTMKTGLKGSILRKVLVSFQFAISIVLVLGTMIVYQQLNFMKSQKLGFDKEQMLILPLRGGMQIVQNYETIKSEFTKHSGISMAAVSSSVPGRGIRNFATSLLGESDDKIQSMNYISVDHDFIHTYSIELIAGRAFQRERATDIRRTFMINEAAVKTFGWASPEEAIGKRIQTGYTTQGEIIGVYKNFHYRSLQFIVEPLVLVINPDWLGAISLKINTKNLQDVLAFTENQRNRLFPKNPFEYFFLDTHFDRQYRSDEQIGQIVFIFSGLAIFIACLGLFGLSSFMAEKRTKEIGIRKVLGSSVSNIVMLLTKEFTKWVIVANIFAWPAAYFIMNKWLQNFAYHTSIKFWVFLLAGGFALIIALLTVSFQSIKAALANPVDSLMYE